MKLTERYFVLLHERDRKPWVLTLDGYTSLKTCAQAIGWQRQAHFKSDMVYHTCIFDAQAGFFVNERGDTLSPEIGPYTRTAWARFLLELTGQRVDDMPVWDFKRHPEDRRQWIVTKDGAQALWSGGKPMVFGTRTAASRRAEYMNENSERV